MRQALKSMSDENTRLSQENEDAHISRRLLEGRVRTLEAELTRTRETSPTAERVRIVLDCWVQTLGHVRAEVSMDGDRAKLVRSMLKRRHSGAKNVDEQTFMLCRAIRGVGLKPYKKWRHEPRLSARPHRPVRRGRHRGRPVAAVDERHHRPGLPVAVHGREEEVGQAPQASPHRLRHGSLPRVLVEGRSRSRRGSSTTRATTGSCWRRRLAMRSRPPASWRRRLGLLRVRWVARHL
jgi:hypothetical protein